MLKPQDLLVVLRLSLLESGEAWTFQQLSLELGMSVSEVHAAVKRARAAMLLTQRSEGVGVNPMNLFEFVVHGVKYCFAPQRGALTGGIPTAHAAPPLKAHFVDDPQPPVWASPEGWIRGEALEPLYRSAPAAAVKNPKLYELLALVDAIRAGRARERSLAEKELRNRWLSK